MSQRKEAEISNKEEIERDSRQPKGDEKEADRDADQPQTDKVWVFTLELASLKDGVSVK